MPYCKACGYELGDPKQDLHDPDNLMEIIEGGVDNEGAHIQVKDGPKGPRMFCVEKGQVTKLIDRPPQEVGEGAPNENGGEESRHPKPGSKVYDLPEDKDSEDILVEVASKPMYGLNEAQIEELVDWSKDYDGQLPPDTFEDILKNFQGVQKQTAQLARQKYEVKLNKLMREKAEDNSGPPIGVTRRPGPMMGGNNGGSARMQMPQRPQPQRGGEQQERDSSDEDDRDVSSREPESRLNRRERRVSRRQELLDEAAVEFADKAAGEMANEFAGMFGDMREILKTVFKRKAEKDPDWFFEKAEKWDLDILDVILEPSDSRREEINSGPEAGEVDRKIDDALEKIEDSGSPKRQPDRAGNSETNKTPTDDELDGNPFDDMEPAGDEIDPEEEQAFEEHFG